MTHNEYYNLTPAKAREHDATIVASLTRHPRWVDEWQEYSCRSKLTGQVYYGSSSRAALARLLEGEEIWARHNVVPHPDVIWGTGEYEQQ
jgi:hypothetical protein